MSEQEEPESVVVTGSSGGARRAIVHGAGNRGAHVGPFARGHEGLAGGTHDVESVGGQALAMPTDASDHQQVEAAAAQAERFGPVATGAASLAR